MKLGLRGRLILSFLGVIVATAGLIVFLATRITLDRFTTMVLSASQVRASRLAPLFADYYAQAGSWDGVQALMEEIATVTWGWHRGMRPMMPGMGMMASEDERLLLLDADNRVVADSQGTGQGLLLSAVVKGIPPDRGVSIVVDGQAVGKLVVAARVGLFTSSQAAFLSQASRWMVLAACATGLAMLLVGLFQAQRIVAPLRALASAARRIAGGDFSQRVPITSQDELGEMAAAFNAMAAELEQQRELRHRAMADIAHELRTPLSVMQIELESIEDGLTSPTPDVLTGLQAQLALLNRLVEDLRMLSLVEAGELALETRPLDVGELIRSAAQRVRSAALDKGVSLSVEAGSGLPLAAGDEQRLAQVLLNLLSNALRHTPAGGLVSVAAQQVGQDIRVSVRDTGEGIPAGELPYVFERFYRADRARSRDAGGSGLGLSIARGLVEAHGGRLWVESQAGQGATFYFTLPVLARDRS